MSNRTPGNVPEASIALQLPVHGAMAMHLANAHADAHTYHDISIGSKTASMSTAGLYRARRDAGLSLHLQLQHVDVVNVSNRHS